LHRETDNTATMDRQKDRKRELYACTFQNKVNSGTISAQTVARCNTTHGLQISLSTLPPFILKQN